jgi:hypothetical protein
LPTYKSPRGLSWSVFYLLYSFLKIRNVPHTKAAGVHWKITLILNENDFKILVAVISFIFSFGLTITIRPHSGMYIEAKIILNILQIMFLNKWL